MHKEMGVTMDLKLELVPVPASDIDRAKAFYVGQLGFHEDVDVRPTDSVRVVQLTPPGSECSTEASVGPRVAESCLPLTGRSRTNRLSSAGVVTTPPEAHPQLGLTAVLRSSGFLPGATS
jgi:hypothetical protein